MAMTQPFSQQLSSTICAGVFASQNLEEANIYDLYGYPIPLYREFNYLDNRLGWSMDYWPERHITQWTISQLGLARRDARYLAETHPEAAGILQQLANYTIGQGSMMHFVVPDEDDVEPDEGIEKKSRKILNRFRRVNLWDCLELEAIIRFHRDGEWFLRLYPDEDGVTKVRFIEPVQIRPPVGEDHNGPWSWGVYTPGYDNYSPTAYNIHNWWTSEDEEVSSQYIVHHKNASNRNQKRGFSSFYACSMELNGARDLRTTTREGEKARALVTYIRQHAPGTTKGQIQTFQQAQVTDPALSRSTITGLTDFDYQKQVPSVRDITNGMEYKEPPKSPNAESSGIGVKQALDAVAVRFGVPSWFTSGDSAGSSFASALVAESPFVKKIESDQKEIGKYFAEVHNRVLSIAGFQDQLPEDLDDVIGVDIAFKSPVVRNALDETKRRLMLVKAKLMSQHTACAEEGLDFEMEQAHMASEPELAGFEDEDGGKDAPDTIGGERQKAEGAAK
jgi:hypothetical protein